MPKFTISTHAAEATGNGGFAMDLHLGSKKPLADVTFDAKTAADALARLDLHLSEIAPLGKPMAAHLTLARGERAPRGFRDLPQRQTLRAVNV